MLKLTTVMIHSEDPKALSDFYAGVLGPAQWEDVSYTGWMLGGAALMIGPHSEVKGSNESPGRIFWNVETEDVKGDFERIKSLGARVVQEPYQPGADEYPDFWLATFADTDGNYFQLASPMPESM